jgi:nucleolar protein TMA23
MDAQAYLMRHGWSGPGNPLNPNRRPGQHGGLGLTRPLLISRRETKIGIGKTPTKDPTNQWWLRGFEEALRGVGKDGGATATGATDDTTNSLTRNGSQLYKFFVRGEVIPGTLRDKEQQAVDKGSSEDKKKEKKKRKRDRDDDDDGSNKRKEEKEKKRKKRKTDEPETTKSKKVKKEKKSKREKIFNEEEVETGMDVSSSDSNKADSTELKSSKRRKRRDEADEKDTDSDKKAEKRKKKKREKMEALLAEEKHVKREKKDKKSDKKRKEKKKKDKDS